MEMGRRSFPSEFKQQEERKSEKKKTSLMRVIHART